MVKYAKTAEHDINASQCVCELSDFLSLVSLLSVVGGRDGTPRDRFLPNHLAGSNGKLCHLS